MRATRAGVRRGVAHAPLWITLLALAACGGDAGRPPDPPPNVVLIIGDDHAAADFGFMGSPVARTPELDRLAEEGTVFRLGYTTASQCRASLRTLLTGLDRLQYRVRLRAVREELERQGLDPTPSREIRSYQTLPRLLAEHGYASFQAGKHWEGPASAAGFDDGMVRNRSNEGHAIVRETMQPVQDFIDAHRDRPFFLWLAPALPHLPFDAPARYYDLYADSGLEADVLGYYANVSRFDAGVGELMEQLESAGLRERTLVVYLSDNGWQPVADGGALGGPRGKYSLFDPGFRTPIVFHWPGRIPAGAVHDALVSTVDVFPTLLDYLGIPQLPDRPGYSLRPVIEGRAESVRDELVAYMWMVRSDLPGGGRRAPEPYGPGGHFIRRGRWRLIAYRDGPPALYDLSADPGETRDVAERHPAVVADLLRRIRDWDRAMRSSGARDAPAADPPGG